ncbi:hypothetical protein ACFFRL_00150 [Agromyces hippuratus]|uniref:hypothetical protein n=1 Tax=Agromyces hippuratus TaxID=286438 RepID=UPI0035EA72C6
MVLEAVENLLADGFTPARDLYLSFGGNEESHGAAAVAIAALFQERGITPCSYSTERRRGRRAPAVRAGSPAMVGVGEKGVLTVRLTARGDGGHASAPPKTTPTARIARAVDRLAPNPFPKRMPRSMRAMLASFVPHTRGASRLLLRLLIALPWVTARVFSRLGGEPAASCTRPSPPRCSRPVRPTTCCRRRRPPR